MEPAIQWMPVLLGGFLGGLLVYLTGLFVDGWREKWRIRHYRSALTAEIDECHRLAGVYQTDQVAAPLYRFPTLLYAQAFPGLLADGDLTGDQSEALLTFYSEVETVNRGLDRIDRLVRQGSGQVAAEIARISLKVDHVIEAYPAARRAAAS